MNFNRIEHINKACQNLDTTLQFYQILFPDWVIRAREELEDMRWLHFGNRQFYISLYQHGAESTPLNTGNIDHIGLVIDNGEEMMALLATNGIEYVVEDSPETKYRIYIKDPDSTWLELVEYHADYALR
jgi:catechol 2,3-dioxygenase-like lactoylglutathione lyase family enzyme